MSFTDVQIKALEAKLSSKHVKSVFRNGTAVSYVEGWHVVAEANRIFGFDGWNRETVSAECIWQNKSQNQNACAYVTRVRISVLAGEQIVVREGTGAGHGSGGTLGEAHESAVKEAETDATKRALATFGNQFGLALYDKDQRGVRKTRPRRGSRLDSWKLYVEGNGQTIPFDDPVDLCIAARQQLEKSHSVADIATFWKRNEATFRELRDKRQELRADDGRHYADFLLSLYAAKLQSLALLDAGSVAASEVNRATGTVRRRGASLPIKKTQRLRNPDHLRSVRTKPCLICGRVPSHAHHIRFAQPSAIARKVSDQWTVPLCSIHHDAVHQRGDERAWWKQEKIDPMTEAERLWRKSAGTEHSERAQISKPLNSAASVPGGKEINN